MISEQLVLDHGVVSLTGLYGDYSSPEGLYKYHVMQRTPARRARTSYRGTDKERTFEQDMKLTRYLWEHQHMTPFEFIDVEFFIVCPIFVARQWHRHRAASINEESLRYVEAREDFYIPTFERVSGKIATNKQGSGSELPDDVKKEYINSARAISEQGLAAYKRNLEMGVAPELARIVLPLNLYTGYFWKSNFRNFIHFLNLRNDPHAQYEIQVYAKAMEHLVRQEMPELMEIVRPC